MKRFLFVSVCLLAIMSFSLETYGQTAGDWVDGGKVTSGYCKRDICCGLEDHPGVDIAKFEGTGASKKSVEAPVKAGCKGTVVKVYKFTGTHYKPGTGATNEEWLSNFNVVVVKCEDGTYTVFGHLSSISVSEGATVTANTEIGKIGGYGYNCKDTFGNHVHIERRTDVSGDGAWGKEEEDKVTAGSKDHATDPIPGSGAVNKKTHVKHSSGGLGVYQYTVANDSASGSPIWYFRVNYGGSHAYEAWSPEGWVASTWTESPKWIEWITTDSYYEIQPGDSLAGFGFYSPDPPAMVNYFMDFDDAGFGSGLSDVPSCKVMGVGPEQIPTLTEWGLIIFGVVLIGFITYVFLRRRRKAVVSYQ